MLEDRAADIVETDIDAFAAGDRIDPRAQILAAVIDHIAGAVAAHEVRLVVGADTGDDAQAKVAGQVHRRQSDPSGGAGNEGRFTRLCLGALGQGVKRGPIVVPDGGSRREVKIGRQSQALRRLGDHPFRESAKPVAACHAVAGTKSGDLFADGDNDAGRFRARHERRRRPQLITARDHQIVHEADGGAVDVDQNFVAGRLGLVDLADRQSFRSAE